MHQSHSWYRNVSVLRQCILILGGCNSITPFSISLIPANGCCQCRSVCALYPCMKSETQHYVPTVVPAEKVRSFSFDHLNVVLPSHNNNLLSLSPALTRHYFYISGITHGKHHHNDDVIFFLKKVFFIIISNRMSQIT